jgi:hypothetical protein
MDTFEPSKQSKTPFQGGDEDYRASQQEKLFAQRMQQQTRIVN